ncbi:MAG: aspartate 1-decarboxylase [Planctomycetota bacterium]
MLWAKLHRACITDCDLEYEGSLTVDEELLERSGILVNEKVQVVDINNGARFETYVIPGPRGKRDIIVNGAAARLVHSRDRIIIMAFAILDAAELAGYQPRVLMLDEHNEPVGTGEEPAVPAGGSRR